MYNFALMKEEPLIKLNETHMYNTVDDLVNNMTSLGNMFKRRGQPVSFNFPDPSDMIIHDRQYIGKISKIKEPELIEQIINKYAEKMKSFNFD